MSFFCQSWLKISSFFNTLCKSVEFRSSILHVHLFIFCNDELIKGEYKAQDTIRRVVLKIRYICNLSKKSQF
jgi:hypothetical protein